VCIYICACVYIHTPAHVYIYIYIYIYIYPPYGALGSSLRRLFLCSFLLNRTPPIRPPIPVCVYIHRTPVPPVRSESRGLPTTTTSFPSSRWQRRSAATARRQPPNRCRSHPSFAPIHTIHAHHSHPPSRWQPRAAGRRTGAVRAYLSHCKARPSIYTSHSHLLSGLGPQPPSDVDLPFTPLIHTRPQAPARPSAPFGAGRDRPAPAADGQGWETHNLGGRPAAPAGAGGDRWSGPPARGGDFNPRGDGPMRNTGPPPSRDAPPGGGGADADKWRRPAAPADERPRPRVNLPPSRDAGSRPGGGGVDADRWGRGPAPGGAGGDRAPPRRDGPPPSRDGPLRPLPPRDGARRDERPQQKPREEGRSDRGGWR